MGAILDFVSIALTLSFSYTYSLETSLNYVRVCKLLSCLYCHTCLLGASGILLVSYAYIV